MSARESCEQIYRCKDVLSSSNPCLDLPVFGRVPLIHPLVKRNEPMKPIKTLIAALMFSIGSVQAGPPFAEFVDPNPNPGNMFGLSVVPLSNGNVVVTSPYDDAGETNAGAVYLFNGATGELISTLTGSHANDNVGLGGVVR
jgi:hypothetical protein